MRITKSRLRQIIKEELQRVLWEQSGRGGRAEDMWGEVEAMPDDEEPPPEWMGGRGGKEAEKPWTHGEYDAEKRTHPPGGVEEYPEGGYEDESDASPVPLDVKKKAVQRQPRRAPEAPKTQRRASIERLPPGFDQLQATGARMEGKYIIVTVEKDGVTAEGRAKVRGSDLNMSRGKALIDARWALAAKLKGQ